MNLSLGLNPLLLIALLSVAAAAAFWMYRGTTPQIIGWRRVLLSSLRFASFALVLFLLAEPLLRKIRQIEDPPLLAVLVDASESITIDSTAGGASYSRAILAELRRAVGPNAMRVYRFGADAERVDSDLPDDSLRFLEGRTDIARALERLRSRTADENVAGVVFVSDGLYNTGRNPLRTADTYPLPVYTVTVGDSTEQRDLAIGRVVTNEIAYRGVELPMDIGVRHAGFGGRRVSVAVVVSGTVLASKTVTLPDAPGELTTSLIVTPDTTGLIRYTVAVTHLNEELTGRNNRRRVSVRVLESRRTVLLLAGAPSPDAAALRRVLNADPDVEVTTRVQRTRGSYLEGRFEDPNEFDLLVLSGWPAAGVPASEVIRVRQAVLDGTPLLFLLDRNTDQRALAGLTDVLPSVPRVVRNGFSEAVLAPTGEGLRHPVLRVAGAGDASPWSRLPPLRVSDSQWDPAPDARVLARMELRGIALDEPLLAVRRRGALRTVALLGSGLWQWMNLPEDLVRHESAGPTLVENLVQWLVAPEDNRPVRVRPAASTFEGGAAIQFSGQVYDESLNPVSDAALELTITGVDQAALPFPLQPVGNGRYRADLGRLPEGAYSYAARAERDGVSLGTDRGTFDVGPLTLEFQEHRADASLMRQIALRTGGRPIRLNEAAGLPDQLRDAGRFVPRLRVEEHPVRLWQQWAFLAAIVLLLSAEWFIRKRRGMA